MKTIKPGTYTQTKKLIGGWSAMKNSLIHHRMLNFNLRHGMIIDKVHEKISFKQSNWLEKYKKFNRQKRNQTKKSSC